MMESHAFTAHAPPKLTMPCSSLQQQHHNLPLLSSQRHLAAASPNHQVMNICGTYKIKFHPDGKGEGMPEYEIDFTPPFKRIPMIAGGWDANRGGAMRAG